MVDTEIKSLKSLHHYLQKLVENRLWLKVIIALFLGVGVGLLLSPQNGWITKNTADALGNWLALPGMLFLKLVQMIMIPLIVASIITGIASNNKEKVGWWCSIIFFINNHYFGDHRYNSCINI